MQFILSIPLVLSKFHNIWIWVAFIYYRHYKWSWGRFWTKSHRKNFVFSWNKYSKWWKKWKQWRGWRRSCIWFLKRYALYRLSSYRLLELRICLVSSLVHILLLPPPDCIQNLIISCKQAIGEPKYAISYGYICKYLLNVWFFICFLIAFLTISPLIFNNLFNDVTITEAERTTYLPREQFIYRFSNCDHFLF